MECLHLAWIKVPECDLGDGANNSHRHILQMDQLLSSSMLEVQKCLLLCVFLLYSVQCSGRVSRWLASSKPLQNPFPNKQPGNAAESIKKSEG